jgi:hypothetical protein
MVLYFFQMIDFDFGGSGNFPSKPYKVSIVNDRYEEQQQRPIETIVTSRTARPVIPVGPTKAVTAAAAAAAAAKTAVSAAAAAAAKSGLRPVAVTKTVVTQKQVCEGLDLGNLND